jgi:hypothetical protein
VKPKIELGDKTPEQKEAIKGIYDNLRVRVAQYEAEKRHSKIPALFRKAGGILMATAEAVFDLYAYFMSLQQRLDQLEAKFDLLMGTKVLTKTMGQRVEKLQAQLIKQEAEEQAKEDAKQAVADKAAELEAQELLDKGYKPEPHDKCEHVEGQDHCGHCVKGAAEVEAKPKPDLKIVEPEGEGKSKSGQPSPYSN